MKKAHFIVSIPAGDFHVIADTYNGKNLDYFDAWDQMILYRYFDPEQVIVTRYRAKDAKTHVRLVDVTYLPGAGQTPITVSWIACRLDTGRTHQIRVHME